MRHYPLLFIQPDPQRASFDFASRNIQGQNRDLSSIQETASELPRPLQSWINSIIKTTWSLNLISARNHIRQRYRDELFPIYNRTIAKKYPFENVENEISLPEFNAFFNKEGHLNTFWNEVLSPFAIRNNRGEITERTMNGLSINIPRAFWNRLRQAQAIQRAFYVHNPREMKVSFKMKPFRLSKNVLKVQLYWGSGRLVYEHGPVEDVNVEWPSRRAQTASLIMQPQKGRPRLLKKFSGSMVSLSFVRAVQNH